MIVSAIWFFCLGYKFFIINVYTVLRNSAHNYYLFHLNLLYSCTYANKSYLIDVDPNTILTPPIQNPGKYTDAGDATLRDAGN